MAGATEPNTLINLAYSGGVSRRGLAGGGAPGVGDQFGPGTQPTRAGPSLSWQPARVKSEGDALYWDASSSLLLTRSERVT